MPRRLGRSSDCGPLKTGRVRGRTGNLHHLIAGSQAAEAPHKRSYLGAVPSPASIFRLQVFQEHTPFGAEQARCDSVIADHLCGRGTTACSPLCLRGENGGGTRRSRHFGKLAQSSQSNCPTHRRSQERSLPFPPFTIVRDQGLRVGPTAINGPARSRRIVRWPDHTIIIPEWQTSNASSC